MTVALILEGPLLGIILYRAYELCNLIFFLYCILIDFNADCHL